MGVSKTSKVGHFKKVFPMTAVMEMPPDIGSQSTDFPENKIDGPVTQIMSIGRWIAEPEGVNPMVDFL